MALDTASCPAASPQLPTGATDTPRACLCRVSVPVPPPKKKPAPPPSAHHPPQLGPLEFSFEDSH